MKKKLILILALIMCLSLAACSNGNSESEDSAKKAEPRDEKEFLIGIATFYENPDWLKTDDSSDYITYTNGDESMITVSYSMMDKDFDNLPNHALRQAQQEDYEITRNEEGKINGYNAKYLDYNYGDYLLGYGQSVRTRLVYIQDYNGVYTFQLIDVGDETFTDEDFDKMVESIEIDM